MSDSLMPMAPFSSEKRRSFRSQNDQESQWT